MNHIIIIHPAGREHHLEPSEAAESMANLYGLGWRERMMLLRSGTHTTSRGTIKVLIDECRCGEDTVSCLS